MKISFDTDKGGEADQLIADIWGDENDPTGQLAATAYVAAQLRDETLRRGLFNIQRIRTDIQLQEEKVYAERVNDEYPRVAVKDDGTIEPVPTKDLVNSGKELTESTAEEVIE